jgi:molybdenum cofactor cytidylyltransferase
MTGLIILAAGESSRMGQPKQKLQYKGKSLLQNAIDSALTSACELVVVVLGSHMDDILPEIKNEPVTIIQNQQWQEGMASSIRVGITELEKNTSIDSVIIMLCDQPFVDAALLNNLVQKKQENEKGIIASSYKNTLGVPVLFSRNYFPHLLLLQGQEGAKKIISRFEYDVSTIPFVTGAIDIDTPEDYESLFSCE